MSVTAPAQEKLTALCNAYPFIERLAKDAVPVTLVAPNQPGVAPATLLPRSHSPTLPDVQITVGLDRGGLPRSVKFVASIISYAHPHSPSITILGAVWPCDDDKYDVLSAML